MELREFVAWMRRLSIKADLDVPDGYFYDPRTRRYHNAQTGQFVPFRVIYSLLQTNEAASAEVMLNLTTALQSGDLPKGLWLAAMQRQIRALHVQNAALGAGGLDQLQGSDYYRIDQALRTDLDRLDRFGAQVLAGQQSLAQIQNRINMYVGNARVQFFKARRPPIVEPHEMVIERRRLQPAEHCSWCIHLADLGWQPYGVLPVPGESSATWQGDQCLTNCQCEMQQMVITRVESALFLGPKVTIERSIQLPEKTHEHTGVTV